MTPEDTIRDINHSWGHGLLLSLLLQGIDLSEIGMDQQALISSWIGQSGRELIFDIHGI